MGRGGRGRGGGGGGSSGRASRGGGGKGGGGGDDGDERRPMFWFFPDFFGLSRASSGLSRDTKDLLRRVAIAKGLRDVDELLTVLGKKGHEIRWADAFDMLRDEYGDEYAGDVVAIKNCAPGKGSKKCNRYLDEYIQASDDWFIRYYRKKLLKYCLYTKDELRQFK